MHYRIDKPEHGSQEWLEVRWKDKNDGCRRISASVAAAVHNEHPYTTSSDLAIELIADKPPVPKPPTPAMERGNRLEPVLLEWVSFNGNNVITPIEMYCYDDGDCKLIATLDGIDGDGNVHEVKTTRKTFNDELPRHWYWQGVQQAICADVDRITWVVFDGTLDLKIHQQIVTSDEKQIHIEACREFLHYINMGVTPPNVQTSYEHVQNMYPETTVKSTDVGVDGQLLVQKLIAVKSNIAEFEKMQDEIQAQLGELLKEAEVGTFEGEEIVSWKKMTRDSLDTKALGEAHPALVSKFRKQTTYRVMKTNKRRK
jgi:predicted phage-related endonuclease